MTPLKERIAKNGHVLNFYLTIPSPFLAEIVAHAGYDAVTLDMQHGLIGYDAALSILTALATVDVVPMVRTPALDPALVMKLLDTGVLGITCANVDDAQQAAALVRACRYPPVGDRSFGPVRAALLHDDYVARESDLLTVFAMIESAAGLANVDSIAAIPGIDGIYIGPYDLAMSMGLPPGPGGTFDPRVDAAVEHILQRTLAAGLIAGMLAPDGKRAAQLVQRGFQFVTISNDVRAMQATLAGWLEDFAAA
ncbi:HpcH/HpaI aldolase family protein [Blastomonas fulva]|uniref:HpcH/HpaI aldolase family protein n=1 Tax=Blastomonas fulva TaxID=1550728 RepID=UPI003F70A311